MSMSEEEEYKKRMHSDSNTIIRMHQRIDNVDRKIDSLHDKIDKGFTDITTKFHQTEVRFLNIEAELGRQGEVQKEHIAGRRDIRQKMTGIAFDLLKMAILAILAAAAWAFANGYTGYAR